jgi:hypothetical protein
MIKASICLAFFAASSTAFSFNRWSSGPLFKRRTPVQKAAYIGDLLTAPGWAQTKEKLDAVPVFTCANSKGEPALYEINDRVI